MSAPASTGPPRGDTHPDDPIVPIYREHTELQMLAARFHELASQLERGEAVKAADLKEAGEVHRRFLVELHYRREEGVRGVVQPTAEPAVKAAFDRCVKEHAMAAEFESRLTKLVGISVPRNARALAELLHKEAERIVEDIRGEEESIFRKIHHTLSPSARAKVVRANAALAGAAAAAHARLAAFSSKVNAAAD